MDTFPPSLAQFGVNEMPTPDWGLSTDLSVNVEKTRLGDGYVFRQAVGINYKTESFSPSWSNLEPEPAEFLYQWLKERVDLIPFLWAHPVTGKIYQVIATGVNKTDDQWNNAVLSVTFEQDHNPVP
jgi:phage-related protein